MRWLIDTDVLIEGERGNPAFADWAKTEGEFATADIIRAEFLIGCHMVADKAKRLAGEKFYQQHIAKLPSFANEFADYELAARLAGEARRSGAKTGLVDGLLAAIALRTGATIATRNLADFKAIGVACENPLK